MRKKQKNKIISQVLKEIWDKYKERYDSDMDFIVEKSNLPRNI